MQLSAATNMEKPLYILIFLLLWSTRIMGGEEGDINVALSPSTQKNGVKSSSTILDKASTSAITKTTATISDPDSDSSETDSPSNRTETKAVTYTPEPLSSNAFTTKLAKDSTEAKTKTLSDSDSDSSERDSPHIKSEASKASNAKTTKGTNTAALSNHDLESPKTDSAIIKSEAPEHASATSGIKKEEFRSLGLASITSEAKTAAMRNLYFESQETDSSTIKSEVPETKPASTTSGTKTAEKRNLDDFEPTETDSSSIKPETPDIEPALTSRVSRSATTMMKDLTTPGVISLNCSSNQSEYLKSQTNSSITLTLSSFGNRSDLCISPISEDSKCIISNTSDKTIGGLSPGMMYNFSVYVTKNNKTQLNESSCLVGPYYTRPNRPNCTEFNKTDPYITNTSITFDFRFNNITSYNLFAYVTSIPNASDMHFSEQIGGLSAATSYSVSLFQYVNDSHGPLLSAESCSLGPFHTLPQNPDCDDFTNEVSVTQRTNGTITLNTSLLMKLSEKNEKKQLCVHVNIHTNQSECKRVELTTMFDLLKSSSSYNFSVFSYYDVSGIGPMVLSQLSCPLGSYYTLPESPNCEEIKTNVTVKDRNARSITLDFNKVSEDIRESLCVRIQSIEPCRNLSSPNIKFEQLNISESYNFSVYSYLNDPFLLSQYNCTILNYTGPDIPVCNSSIVTNKTTTSMFLDLSNLGTAGAESYIAVYNNDSESTPFREKSFSKTNKYIQNITNLKPGTSYTLRIFAVSEHRIRSADSCKVERVYTYPGQPTKFNYTSYEKSLQFFWERPDGKIDSYDLKVQCLCLCCCEVKYNNPVQANITSANVTGLIAGTYCNVSITAISGELRSISLQYNNIETTETAPGEVLDVTITNITHNGFTISWSEPDKPNGKLINYNVNLSAPGVRTENFSKLTPGISFDELNPGMCYNVTVAAVNRAGEGKKSYKIVYTKETVPSKVTYLMTSNTSSTSITVRWSKPQNQNGVIKKYQIVVWKGNEQKGDNLKQIITLKCNSCKKSCPTAVDHPQESSKADENKELDKLTIEHEVPFTEGNGTFQYVVTGLEIFTSYSFNVTAFTSAGHGEWATNVTNTSEDKPSRPGQPTNINVQVNSLSFKYSKPEKENGVITVHEIEYSYTPYNMCSDIAVAEYRQTKEVQIIHNGNFSASLGNLQPFWSYTIRVRVSTYAGFSNYSLPTSVRTLPTTPEQTPNITAEQISSRYVYLSWIQPCHPNGIITNYIINVTNVTNRTVSESTVINTKGNETSYNVTKLLPYQKYNVTVYTQVKDVSNLSDSKLVFSFRTNTEAPYRPENINVNSTSNSLSVSWKHPKLLTGPTEYKAIATDLVNKSSTSTCSNKGFYNTFCTIDGLDSYWNYSVTVQAIVGTFAPSESTIHAQTNQSAPGKVSSFTVTQDPNVTRKTNVRIKWSPPTKRDLNGIITNYFLQYWYQPNQKMVKSYGSTLTKATVFVDAEKAYTFQIFAKTKWNATKTDYVTQNLVIKPGAPLPPPKQNISLINKGPPASDDQTQIAVAFRRAALCDDSNGKIIQWYIIVSKMPGVKAFSGARKDYIDFIQKTYKKWEDVYEKDVSIPYIASDSWKPNCDPGSRRKRSVTRETVSYTLGSDGECESGNRKYCNGNLEPGQTYRVRYGVCTTGGCLESEFSEPFQTAPNHIPAIAGSLTAVVLALAVTIVVVIVLKRKGKGPFKSVDNGEVGQQNEGFSGVEMKGISKPKAVKIADFANYVQKLHADSNLLFSSEYKLLKETCPTHTTKAAEVQVNRIKNRYTNILSYDHSRVKLLPTEDDEGSDYINANYMPGFTSPREYIATQGPLPFTRDDFWRMIWEQNVSIIVMLTQLVERGRRKCDIYWPEASREPVYYGDLVVELESESTLPDYVLRVMSIKLGNRVRKVKQLHYLKWPDMGCPETTWLLLNFVGATRLYLPHNDPGPIVVHCSAGVGRTGTFIAVDYLMQYVRTSDVIDIYSYVMKMRNNRPNMVQTEDQYVFIHDCIKDYVNKNDDDTDDEEEEEETQEDQSIYMNV